MRGGVLLEEVVLAAVAGELELGADADGGAGGLGAGDGLLDVAEVGVEVHRPLVEVARGDTQQPHLARRPASPSSSQIETAGPRREEANLPRRRRGTPVRSAREEDAKRRRRRRRRAKNVLAFCGCGGAR